MPLLLDPSIDRSPKRNEEPAGRVTLTCRTCSRTASYLVRASMSSPEEPRHG